MKFEFSANSWDLIPIVMIYNFSISSDYSNQYNNNQHKSTTSSTYRPITTASPQTFATKPPQTTTYTQQSQAPKNYNSNNYDYDEALVSQVNN